MRVIVFALMILLRIERGLAHAVVVVKPEAHRPYPAITMKAVATFQSLL